MSAKVKSNMFEIATPKYVYFDKSVRLPITQKYIFLNICKQFDLTASIL